MEFIKSPLVLKKNSKTAKLLVGVFALTFMLSMTVQPLVFTAWAGAVLTITCDNVSISEDTWTFSGTWKAVDIAGQPATQYDGAIFSPASVLKDNSSKDSPDSFLITQSDTNFAGEANKNDAEGTWSNEVIFSSAPSAVYGTLYHAQVPGNEKSGDAVCQFTLPNGVPVAVNDIYSTNEDTTLNVSSLGVLSNDTDSDDDSLTASLVTNASNGTVTLNSNGGFSYVPNASFYGTDTFTYKANDGENDSNVATVTITVDSVNDAPVAVAESYLTDEDTAINTSAPGVLSNDSDSDDSGPSALTAVLGTGTLNGVLDLNSDGSFDYSPNANFNGSDSFTYSAYDGGLPSNLVTVNITVNAKNDAPVGNDDSYNTNEEQGVTTSNVLANDTDVDLDILSVSSADLVSANGGTVVNNNDGTFIYTPVSGYVGSDTFSYIVSDGSLTDTATVTILVSNVNDAPVAVDDSYSTDEDSALTIDVADGVLDNDSDVDSGSLTAVLVVGPSNGTLTLLPDGSFVYAPGTNFNGSDSFTYKANDGSADSGVVTVNITVNPINDAPVAISDTYNANEDLELEVASLGVLLNDSDVDGDSLTAELVTDVSNGDLELNADGSFTYMPSADFNGTDSFTYKANDGDEYSNTVTVTINVGSVPDSQCDDEEDNDGDEDVDFEEDSGCTDIHDDWEEENPPVSTFDNLRLHEIIVTELVSLVLSGSSEDDESGFGSANIELYQLANAETMLADGFFIRPSETEPSPFQSLTCSPLPQNAVPLASPIPLTLIDTDDDLIVDWSYDWTIPGKGVYCAIVHATDAAGNLENTGITGPFAYNPAPVQTSPSPSPSVTPTPTPGCTSGCGGGGNPGVPLPPAPPAPPAPAPTPAVLGITTLPATSAPMATSVTFALFAAFMVTGMTMLMIGSGLLPRRIKNYLK